MSILLLKTSIHQNVVYLIPLIFSQYHKAASSVVNLYIGSWFGTHLVHQRYSIKFKYTQKASSDGASALA